MTVLRFSAAARALALAAARLGLVAPAFRSPPRLPGAERTVRRFPRGGVVAVRIRDRQPAAVLADMVEGVLAVNGLTGEAAAAARPVLLSAVDEEAREAA